MQHSNCRGKRSKRNFSSKSILLAFQKFLCSIGSCECNQLQLGLDFHARGMVRAGFDACSIAIVLASAPNANFHQAPFFVHIKNSCAPSGAANATNCNSCLISMLVAWFEAVLMPAAQLLSWKALQTRISVKIDFSCISKIPVLRRELRMQPMATPA